MEGVSDTQIALQHSTYQPTIFLGAGGKEEGGGGAESIECHDMFAPNVHLNSFLCLHFCSKTIYYVCIPRSTGRPTKRAVNLHTIRRSRWYVTSHFFSYFWLTGYFFHV